MVILGVLLLIIVVILVVKIYEKLNRKYDYQSLPRLRKRRMNQKYDPTSLNRVPDTNKIPGEQNTNKNRSNTNGSSTKTDSLLRQVFFKDEFNKNDKINCQVAEIVRQEFLGLKLSMDRDYEIAINKVSDEIRDHVDFRMGELRHLMAKEILDSVRLDIFHNGFGNNGFGNNGFGEVSQLQSRIQSQMFQSSVEASGSVGVNGSIEVSAEISKNVGVMGTDLLLSPSTVSNLGSRSDSGGSKKCGRRVSVKSQTMV